MKTTHTPPQVAAHTPLHEAAKRVIELHRAQYIRGNGDGGRVSHAFMQLEKAVLTPAPETAAERDRLRDALKRLSFREVIDGQTGEHYVRCLCCGAHPADGTYPKSIEAAAHNPDCALTLSLAGTPDTETDRLRAELAEKENNLIGLDKDYGVLCREAASLHTEIDRLRASNAELLAAARKLTKADSLGRIAAVLRAAPEGKLAAFEAAILDAIDSARSAIASAEGRS